MKRLIINADDFGLSLGVSQGIALAAKTGVLTSTTIMGNMPDLREHLQLLDDTVVGLGVHLVLSAGKPVLAPDIVPSLVDEQGLFRRNFRQAVKLATPHEVKQEWQTQIEHILSLGVKPTHIDSHHHVHMVPRLTRIAIELAHYYGIPAIRRFTWHDVAIEQGLRQAALVSPMVVPSARIIARSGLKYPDGLIALTEDNLERLENIGEGTYEMFCHPGVVDAELRSKSSLLTEREDELRLLTTPCTRKILVQAGVVLINFGVFST
ncbi:MAG: ChbG/HpnK family deacetylase [Bacillota bacterium]|nr:ChbG/HpnK family deacetylase [Bacillota bacterium]